MRSSFRAVAFLALAIVAITCTDAPTGPSPRQASGARITVAPSFTVEAAQAFQALAASGMDVTEVHVVLTGDDGSSRDVVMPFPVTQDTLQIDIPLDGVSADQSFTALFELRNANHVVLFSGTQRVTARDPHAPVIVAPPVVTIKYTGPGRTTRSVSLTPPDTIIPSTGTLSYSASALDSAGKPVSGLLVVIRSSDTTVAAVTTTGDATATVRGLGKRGTVTVTATTPLGVAGTARLLVVPQPARVVIVSGGAQSGVAGSTLAQPLVVEVQASDNLPVPGANVTFRAVTQGGAVQSATTTADANGRASTALTLGTTAGSYQFEAASGTLPVVTVTATATPAPAAQLEIVSGDNQVDSIGAVLAQPLVVKVTDQFGGAVSGATVNWTRASGTGALSAASSITASNGTTSVSYTLGGVAGSETVRANINGLTTSASAATFNLQAINRGVGTIAIVSGGGQSGAANATLTTPMVAHVADALGNPTANATVTWSAAPGGTTFSPASGVTNASGNVSTIATLGNTPGVVTVTAHTGPLSTNTTLTITGPASNVVSQLVVISAAQSGAILSTLAQPIVIEARNAANQPVAGATIAIAPQGNNAANGVPSSSALVTNASGQVSFTWKLGRAARVDTLSATSGSASQIVTATAIAGPPSQLLVKTSQPLLANNAIPTGGSHWAPYVVIVSDSGGVDTVNTNGTITIDLNPASNLPDGTISGNKSVAAVNGVATFTNLSIDRAGTTYQFDISAISLPGVPMLTTTPPFTINVGGAARLRFFQYPLSGTGGTVLSPSIQAAVVDSGGNAVTPFNAPTFAKLAILSGPTGAVLTGDSAVFVNGLATFANATVDLGGSYTFTVASPNGGLPQGGPIPPDTTQAITVAAGVGGSLVAKAGSALIVTPVGGPSQVQPIFVLKSAGGVPLTGDPVSLSLNGRCRFTGNSTFTSLVTDANGEVKPTVLVPSGATGAGCVVYASSSFAAHYDSSLVAVYPSSSTHVWIGGTSTSWSTASNWYTLASPTSPSVPSASSAVFVPFFPNVFNAPTVLTRPAIASIVLDSVASVNLNGVGMDVGGSVGGFGIFLNGGVRITNTGSLNGIFDQLDIGASGSCGSLAPLTASVRTISANVMNVYCRTNVDTSAAITTLTMIPNSGRSTLSLTSPSAALAVSGAASFSGDTLNNAGGNLVVNGAATFGGSRVNATTGSKFSVAGTSTFNSASATFAFNTINLLGDVTFGGGNAGQQSFQGGTLLVNGNFTQLTGNTSLNAFGARRTFTTSSDHVTRFTGSTTQTVSIADDSTSQFSIIQASNSSAGGVVFATNASGVNGTTQPRVEIIGGKLQVNAGFAYSASGGTLRLDQASSNLNLLGTFVGGSCSGRSTGATITGTGNYNTTPVSQLPGTFCVP